MEPKYSKKTTTLANGSTRCYYYKTVNGTKCRVPAEEYKKHAGRKKTGGACAEPRPGEPSTSIAYVDCVKAQKAWCDDYQNQSQEYRERELEKYGEECSISDEEVKWCKEYAEYAKNYPENAHGKEKDHYDKLCSRIQFAAGGKSKSKPKKK